MGIIWAIIIGFIVGLVARALMPGRDPLGIVMTIVLGVVGALLANLIGSAIGWYRPEEPAGIIASIIGAMAVLWVYRKFQRHPVRAAH